MLTTYMRRMRNNNLDIRIAGFSRRPQLLFFKTVVFWRLFVLAFHESDVIEFRNIFR